MYILQNAGKNIGRNKGRNILLGIIIFAIIATSAVALIINNTANGIIDDYRERFGSEVRITPDMERLRNEVMGAGGGGGFRRGAITAPVIPPEQLIALSRSPYLRETVFTATISVHNSPDISPIDEELGGASDMLGAAAGMMRRGAGIMGGMGGLLGGAADEIENIGEEMGEALNFYANLVGSNHMPDEFIEGTRQLAAGRFCEAFGEAIVSRDLLENSGLAIGDVITLTSTLIYSGEEQLIYDISYTLEIVGYFDDVTQEYTIPFMQNAFFNRRNEIITTADTVMSGLREGFAGVRVTATYYLRSPDMLAAFEAEARAGGLSDMFIVSTDEEGYNTIVQPVEGLRGVTFTFMIVVLALGAVVLILLSTLAIRERKYEIGVLRAMGMKKSRVALGLLSEMSIITAVCLVLGLGAGMLAAQPVSDMLLENQLRQIEPAESARGGTMGRAGGIGGMLGLPGANSPAEALQSMDVSMSPAAIGQIILVSLLLAIISGAAGIVHVTKYEPIKILSDRT